MPRIARKDLNSNFFHIIAQGINKEYIFKNEWYIEKYKKILLKDMEIYNISILAYCIMNNHIHLLLYTESNQNMSKFMHHVNLQYGQYYNYKENRVGIVFRNRFLSQAIFNENYLLNCIEYIHNNPVKAKMVTKAEDYKYSSCKFYTYGEKDFLIRNSILGTLTNINDNNQKNIFLDVDFSEEDIINEKINEFQKKYNMSTNKIKNDTQNLKLFINSIKNEFGRKISNEKLAKHLGISRKTLYRYLLK